MLTGTEIMRTLRRVPLLTMMAAMSVLVLAGCGNNNSFVGTLRSSGIAGTPDEFMVLPTRPLELPQDFATLPAPTPGAPNRVDRAPEAIAVAGLSGRPGNVRTASGTALLARAGAGANDPAIRRKLALEDAEYQRRNRGRFLERIFSRNREALVYGDMTLNSAATYENLRARGLTMTTPPPDLLSD